MPETSERGQPAEGRDLNEQLSGHASDQLTDHRSDRRSNLAKV